MAKKREINVKITADKSDFDRKAKGFNRQVIGMQRATITASKSIAAMGTAAAAASAGIALFARSQADANREVQALARLSGVSQDEFRGMAFASRQFGVEQAKLADILKDTQDKVGDFLATGGGPLKDFFDNIAPQVGVTAKEFANLSGRDALQAYVDALEKANLSQSEMTFYMEAIANDSTRLIPLFSDQGKELDRLTDRYRKTNGQLELTAAQQQNLQTLSEEFDGFSTAAGSAASVVAATLAPAFSDFFNGVTEHIPKATQAVVDFFNSFIAGANLSTIEAVEGRIESLTDELGRLTEKSKELQAMSGENDYFFNPALANEIESTNYQLAAVNQELKDTISRREELANLDKTLKDASTFSGGSFVSGGSSKGKQSSPTGFINTANDEFGFNPKEDPFSLAGEQGKSGATPRQSFGGILDVANDEYGFGPKDDPFDPEAIAARNEEILQLERDLWTNKGAITEHGLSSITGMIESSQGKQAGVYANSFASILGSTATYSKKAFEINKKFALGDAVVKGYQSATAAWSAGMSTGGPQAPLVAAAYLAESLFKTGKQIKAIKAQSFGGGGSGSAGGGTGGASGAISGASVPQQSNVRPVSTIVNMTVQGDSISRSQFGSITKQLNEEYEAGYRLNIA